MNISNQFVELTFENFELVRIPFSCFSSFKLEDITPARNPDARYAVANTVSFSLLPVADQPEEYFDLAFFDAQENGKLFSRLMQPDILYIDLVYADGSSDSYMVAWQEADDCEYHNTLETVKFCDNGELQIQITRKHR